MEVRRHERRGRLSRSTRDASNKENICPLEASLTTEMTGSTRSPLPPGFPRSPLQDITHIIYPPNIWPEVDDPLSGQLHKKCKKESSAEVEAQNANVGNSGSWKGLKSCVHVRLQTEEPVGEEVMSAQVNPEPISLIERGAMNDPSEGRCVVEQGRFEAQAHSLDHALDDGVNHNALLSPFPLESCGEASLISQAFSVHQEVPAGFASNATIEKNEGKCIEAPSETLKHSEHDGVANKVQRLQHAGEKVAECSDRGKTLIPAQFSLEADKPHLQEQSESCEAGSARDLQKNGNTRAMPKRAAKEVNCNRQGQTTQLKKKSTLSMLR